MIPNQNPRVHSCAVRRKAPKPDYQLYFSTGQSKNSESGAPIFQFESSNEIQVDHDSRATATLETKTELSKDAWAIRERVLKCAEEDLTVMRSCTKGFMDTPITRLDSGESKLLLAKRWECLTALPGLLLTFEQLRELIISQTYTGIHASFCMTVDGYLCILTGGTSCVDIRHENRPTLITRIR